MATADRILQLKLISDVSDINRKMSGVTQDVGRVGKAFGQLKSFVAPVLTDIGLQLATGLTDAFKAQLKHAEELRNAFVGLEAAGKAIALPEGKIRGVADQLRDIGVSLGVGEDAKIVSALRDILTITGKIRLSTQAVEAIFDVMRLFNVDFDTAKQLVVNGIILGRSRDLDKLGISGETAAKRLRNFNEKFGQTAEEFATTSEGKWAIATAQFDGHMLNLAILADEAMLNLKGALVIGWDNLLGIVGEISGIWEGLKERWGKPVGEAIANLSKLLAPVGAFVFSLLVSPFQTAIDLLGAVWKAIIGDLEGARDDIVGIVRGLANSVINLLNQMSAAFAFSFRFDIPEFEVPDPTQLLEGGKIKIGGGSVDFSRGRLFDEIPRLAAGGIVRRPTLALVGESGPEAVMPLGSAMGYTINVYAAVASPADVGRGVVEAIEAYERRAGSSWRA